MREPISDIPIVADHTSQSFLGSIGSQHRGRLVLRELGAEQGPEMILTIRCAPTYRCISPNAGVELAVVLYALGSKPPRYPVPAKIEKEHLPMPDLRTELKESPTLEQIITVRKHE